MTNLILFLLHKEKWLEKRVSEKELTLTGDDPDLQALGRINPNNTVYNINMASLEEPEKAIKFLRKINPLESEKIAKDCICIYGEFTFAGLVSQEEYAKLLHDAIRAFPTAEVMNLAGMVYVDEFNDWESAMRLGLLCKKKFGDTSIINYTKSSGIGPF